MSLRINLNNAALLSSRSLRSNDDSVTRSIERLSSGYKINRAADNPAGLAISEALRAQIGGLKQAISNTQDAVNMVKTAEGALAEVHNLLRSMRDLGVHALNTGAVDATQLNADQAQIASALEALNRISSTTAFAGKKLLDGSAGFSSTVTNGTSTGTNYFVSASSTAKSSGGTAYTITIDTAATQRTVTGVGAYTAETGSVTINNVAITLDSAVHTTAALAVDRINEFKDETGVVADLSGGFVRLTTQAYGSDAAATLAYGGDVDATSLFGGAPTVAAGQDVVASFTGGPAGGDVASITGKGRVWAGAGDLSGAQFFLGGTAGTVIADITNNALTFQVGANVNQTAGVAIQSTHTTRLGLGAEGLEAQGTVTPTNLSQIDVRTEAGARNAVKLIDQAISQISTIRGDLGAVQKNVFESAISSLSIAIENLAASESSIRDADMATEIAEFSKNQILMQSSVAMLAQANQAPQALLQLLR